MTKWQSLGYFFLNWTSWAGKEVDFEFLFLTKRCVIKLLGSPRGFGHCPSPGCPGAANIGVLVKPGFVISMVFTTLLGLTPSPFWMTVLWFGLGTPAHGVFQRISEHWWFALSLEETELCPEQGWHCPPAPAGAPWAQGWGHSLVLAQLSCTKGAPAAPKLCGASAPHSAFHCLGKILSPALLWLSPVPPCSTADSGHFYHLGTFFPCFYTTASSQRQEDSQTFPEKGVSTLAASATGSAHCCFHRTQVHQVWKEFRHLLVKKRVKRDTFACISATLCHVCISSENWIERGKSKRKRKPLKPKDSLFDAPVLPPDFECSLVISRQSPLRLKGEEKLICPQRVTVRLTFISFFN